MVFYFFSFPGTELTDYAFNKGYLGKEFDYDSLDKSFFLETKLEIPHKREIQNLKVSQKLRFSDFMYT